MNLFTATVFTCCLAPTLQQDPPSSPAPVAQAPAKQDPSKQEPAKLDEKAYDHFGAGIATGAAVAITDALKTPEQYVGKTVRLTGPIEGVCQTKGCWMQLGKAPQHVFVKFKDYAFFVPKDASGRTAVIEGTMALKQETVAETRHYLEDAGKHEEAAKVTEGRKLFTFMADGVAIKKATRLDEQHWDHFGAGIVEGRNVDLATAFAKPEDYVGKTVRLTGPIEGVCQTKGCWMQLGKAPQHVFVKFKDYAFFVPKDASGRTAIIEGTMALKQETVAETKHYLEDAGKHAEAAKVTEGRKLYTFMADGVAIAKPVKTEKTDK